MSDASELRPDLERALARYRQAPESRLFAPLAAAYRAAKQPQEALRTLRAGVERHPQYVSALVLLGQCCNELQLDEEAEAAFARVLELDPENLAGLRFRAERARRRGAIDRAAVILRRVLEIDPFDREVQADLGLLTTALERRTRAMHAEAPPAESAARALPPPPPPMPEPSVAPATARLPTPPPEPSPPPPALAPPPPPPSAAIAADTTPEPFAPPAIDLRRVGEAPPDPELWRFTRDEDRIIVQPEAPVRGPIRSVEDRLWSERRLRPALPPPPEAPVASPRPPAPPTPAAPPALPSEARAAPPAAPEMTPEPAGEFATLTLARIYESQGYYEKALAIYDELGRRHPNDPEIAAALVALQRRLAGVPEGELETAPEPAAWPEPQEEPEVEWRLLDPRALQVPESTAQHLRDVMREVRDQERARRHTVLGTPGPEPSRPAAAAEPPRDAAPSEPPAAEPPHEDLNRGHADFERFLAYIRSLQRGEGSS